MDFFSHLAGRRSDPPQHAKRGRKFTFHGSFKDKSLAVAKERRTSGAFIREKEIKGETYYLVLTPNK